MRLGAVLSLVSLVVRLDILSSPTSAWRRTLYGLDDSEGIREFYLLFAGLAVVACLISVTLWLWMAAKNGEGRSWARIVATGLAGLVLLRSLTTDIHSGPLPLFLTVVELVLAVVTLYLLWRRQSSGFYAACRATENRSRQWQHSKSGP